MQHNPRFLALVDGIRSRITETDVHQIKRWQDEGRTFHLIDVREESEWAKGHLPGAQYLGRGVIERISRPCSRIPRPHSISIVVAVFAPYWRPTICNRWVIAT